MHLMGPTTGSTSRGARRETGCGSGNMADIDPFADTLTDSSLPHRSRAADGTLSEDPDLPVPSMDEVWPAGADASAAEAPRGFVRPRSFPLAPPIRPLSFTTEDPVPRAS